ncbi:FAD/NAD(P)-binding domain-containing protein [Xylariomycetidae sp. FL2044]|nr:FAD/NAD(P)-binding domain-containing protein [Xylariomycetidae sp. FL2044]
MSDKSVLSELSPARFRVIVVGAGPVGLYLALALSRANIDFLVLEQHHTVLRHAGAGLLLYAQSLRLLDQIGLLEKANYSIFNTVTELLASNGRILSSTPFSSVLREKHAYPGVHMSRGELIELLYESLPEKDRIRTGAAVVDVETSERSVKVHLKDGSTQEGSIVIGVDGVYSQTRRSMQRIAQMPPETWPMTASWNGLYGYFPPHSSLTPCTIYSSRTTGFVSQVLVGERGGHFAIVRAMSPTTESPRYTTEDRDRAAEEIADRVIAPGVSFKEIWDLAVQESAAPVLASQEEGYCDRWYHGRIALVSDAVHKVTSVPGLGVNEGINSAAALANELYSLLESDPDPSTHAIEDAFFRYQEARKDSSSHMHTCGRDWVRRTSWATWSDWFIDRFVVPWFSAEMRAMALEKNLRSGETLDYIPFEDKEPEIPWAKIPAWKRA